jgi:Tol biopolymer transport system component
MRSVIGLLAVLVGLVALAAPAQATFPGRNGGIAFGLRTSDGDHVPVTDHARLEFLRQPLAKDRTRSLIDCVMTDGVPTGGDCTATNYAAPSYSADGEAIVFEAGNRIAIIDADGGAVVLQPATTADDGDPCFSPDGKRIAFTGANDQGGTDIYIRRVKGGAAQMIVHDASEPAWSSSGRLAYVQGGHVYSADSKGRARRLVSSGVSPDWSPNGRRLALVRPTSAGPVGRLYTVAATGRDVRRVGRSKNTSHPVWSPDGRWLAYYGFDLGIHVKRVGSPAQATEVAPTQVSGESGSVVSFDPAWRPR